MWTKKKMFVRYRNPLFSFVVDATRATAVIFDMFDVNCNRMAEGLYGRERDTP